MPEPVSEEGLKASSPARLALLALGAYKRWLSPLLPRSCRFHPTCADYCAEAIRRHGLMCGARQGGLRLLRCQPLSHGGFDPVR